MIYEWDLEKKLTIVLSSSEVFRMRTAAKCSNVQNYYFSFLNLQNVLFVVIVFHWYTLKKQEPIIFGFTHVERKKRDIAKHLYLMFSILRCRCVFLNSLELHFIWVALLAWGAGFVWCIFAHSCSKVCWIRWYVSLPVFSCVSMRGCSGSYFSLSLSMSIPR